MFGPQVFDGYGRRIGGKPMFEEVQLPRLQGAGREDTDAAPL
jgi:hypothetical protein